MSCTGHRQDFDTTIGQLDRVLSKLIYWAEHANELDSPDRQTLKHHAEDMVGAGQKILKELAEVQ